MLINIFLTAFNAVTPIVLLILFGYLLKQKGFLNESFTKIGSKLVFNIFLPAMLFINVYEIPSMESITWDLMIYCLVMVFVLFAIGLVLALITTKDPRRRGPIWQCTLRSNFAIIGMPLAAALGGDDATAVAAMVVAVAVPAFNILSVIALSVFVPQSGGSKISFKGVVKDILRNSLTQAVFAGLACLVIRALQIKFCGRVVFALNNQTAFLYKAIKNLSSVCSPFALIVLGAQCEFSAVKGMFKELSAGIIGRLILAPMLCLGGAILLNKFGVLSCGANEFPALVAVFGSPTAVSGAIMAAEMKNDDQLATQMVMWTSVVSVLTIFVIVCVLMSMGLLAA